MEQDVVCLTQACPRESPISRLACSGRLHATKPLSAPSYSRAFLWPWHFRHSRALICTERGKKGRQRCSTAGDKTTFVLQCVASCYKPLQLWKTTSEAGEEIVSSCQMTQRKLYFYFFLSFLRRWVPDRMWPNWFMGWIYILNEGIV